ncbi:MAG: radical SAM protein [Candidatus Gracilibacteria bacterium]|nr:radical SAM protein [Candidatus Gracilibacteria bacterium]
MTHIEINIGKTCNSKCIFCMSTLERDQKKPFPIFSDIQKQIIEYANKGYKSIGFLGGEITIHPDIIDIIREAKKNNFQDISIITNSFRLSDYNFTKELLEAGLTRVNISIHSYKDEVEDYLTGIKGGLQKKLQAIDNLNKLKQEGKLKGNLSINIVLNKLNLKDILETCVYFYKEKRIEDIRINFLWPQKDTSKYYEEIIISYIEAIAEIKKVIMLSLKYGLRISFSDLTPCIFRLIDGKNYEKLIKVFLGEEFDSITQIHNIGKENVVGEEKFSWKDRKKNILKTKFEKCSKCKYDWACEGVRKEYIEYFGENEFNIMV